MTGQARVALVAALLIVGLATGCGSERESVPSPTGAPSTFAGTATPISAEEREVLDAYRGMWDAWVEASKTANPDAPALRTYTSGEALKLIVSVLATNQHNKQVALGAIGIDPKVASLRPSTAPTGATVNDCVNDEKWLMHKSSGGLVDDVPGGRHSMTATVTRVDATWKVTKFTLGRAGTC